MNNEYNSIFILQTIGPSWPNALSYLWVWLRLRLADTNNFFFFQNNNFRILCVFFLLFLVAERWYIALKCSLDSNLSNKKNLIFIKVKNRTFFFFFPCEKLSLPYNIISNFVCVTKNNARTPAIFFLILLLWKD